MTAMPERGSRPDPITKVGYVLEFDEDFAGDRLDTTRWIPHYLPQWSSRAASAARHRVGGGHLDLRIEADQAPWEYDLDGPMRVSNLQTGLFAGPVGSDIGQHGVHAQARVREEWENQRLYTPHFGVIEMRAKAIADENCMVALWLIGYEEVPEHSGEICVAEIFGRDVTPESAAVGMGIHPFDDPALRDDFTQVQVPMDARRFHTYTVEWTPERVSFFVDGRLQRSLDQSPDYPMQLMLNIYEFPTEPREPAAAYPKHFVVDHVRGYRPLDRPANRLRGTAALAD
ncbi:glycoside hydrolase family 16 protein [Nocardiopsis sp. YSL2]|uniref:glycoside hydrolase family 16 protein n=1 Tax=Nocardiopsis sp. YSL2 TaxID=2939492 RepID=UPI0026F44436|nr:glycoside hydrolase family 16 protein [Nocardiopsis sp. YSL2]